ncbi:hypothetical protein K502DRAFT_67722 [Neoconidiobolus thromboides FSU 785]|nr:hypothetical protein K502DRAFT_67722 [Neoconidiobolus thromboides FSU 785]
MMQNQGGGFNTSGFGAQNVSKPTTINTFGQSSTQNKPTLSLTGNNSGSAFGASTQQGGSLFGGTSTSTQQSGNLFGSASSNTQQGGSLFGNTSATAQQGSNLFGSASNTTQQNSGLFGNTSTTSQQGAGLFGNTSVTNQTVNNLGGFGQKNGLSINTATTQAGAFGSSLSQPNTALFPNNTLNAKSTAIATQGFNFNLQKSGTGFGTITQPSTSFNTNLQQSQGQFNPNAKQYLTGGEGAIQLNATNLLNPNRQEDANGFVINSGLFDENSKEIPARLVTGGSKPVIILPVKDQDGNYNTEKGPFLFKRPNTGLENLNSLTIQSLL